MQRSAPDLSNLWPEHSTSTRCCTSDIIDLISAGGDKRMRIRIIRPWACSVPISVDEVPGERVVGSRGDLWERRRKRACPRLARSGPEPRGDRLCCPSGLGFPENQKLPSY